MATSKRRNDNLRGKLGRTVSYPLNGQLVTREIGLITKPPTIPQLIVRQRTEIIAALLKPVKEFVEVGFELETRKTLLNPYNMATSVNRLNAIVGDYPNQQVDFTKASFSKGRIPVNKQIQVSVTDIGLKFSWDPEFILPGMQAKDRVMLIAYCPEKASAFCQLDGAKRKEGTEQISIPRYHEQILIHTYLSFIASDRKSISSSVYTGKLLW